MYTALFQHKLESLVVQFEKHYEEKPTLLQISKQDFKKLLPYRDESSKYGLRIKGVATIGVDDIAIGQYNLVP
jgi:hypothetical protein